MNATENKKPKENDEEYKYVYNTSLNNILQSSSRSEITSVIYNQTERWIHVIDKSRTIIYDISPDEKMTYNDIGATFCDISINDLTMKKFMEFYYKYFSDLGNKSKMFDTYTLITGLSDNHLRGPLYYITTDKKTRKLDDQVITYEIYNDKKYHKIDKNYVPISVGKNGCYILWSVIYKTPFTDINHFTNHINIEHVYLDDTNTDILVANYGNPKIKCTKCCFGLEWQSCGKGSQINYICKESQDYNTCRLEETGIHKCSCEDIENKNFADFILKNKCKEQPETNIKNIIENKEKSEEKQKQEKYLYECDLCGIKFKKNEILPNPHPAITPCKKFNEMIVDLKFWIIKIILTSFNTMVSLSIINLENLPYDFTGLVTDTYEILYPINDKPLLAYNLTFLLGYMLLFEMPFLRREMCVIQVLIDNHHDRFVSVCTKKILNQEYRKGKEIFQDKIIAFKKKVCDIYFILGCIYFAIASFATFIVQFTIASYDEHPIIFTIIQLFKLQFMFTMISRFMNLNLYRICSADKYKFEDISNNYPHEKYYEHNIKQYGDTQKWWLFD